MDSNEPGAAILALFDKIISRVKETQPLRSDDKPLKGGRVYSMRALGMPVNPVDYVRPWTPHGALTVAASVPTPPIDPATGAAAHPAPDPEQARSLAAAFKTSLLCTNLLSVTDDQTYQPYQDGRRLDYAYPAILSGMQPEASAEPDDPSIVAAVDKANRILWQYDANGTNTGVQTPKSLAYQNNTRGYGNAVKAFADAYAAARKDPALFEIWPSTSIEYQDAVDFARSALIAGGAAEVEGANDTLASVGHPYQAHLVAAANDAYKRWDLRLAGTVPLPSPYCLILPTDWASDDPNACQGWETIEVTSDSYSNYNVTAASSQSQYSWFNKSSSISGGGSARYGFFSLSGNASHASTAAGSTNSAHSSDSDVTYTDAKNLHIKLSYALCTVERPWFVGDLFYMKDWYLKGAKKGDISTGNINDQIQKNDQLLPMVPQQMLVIRNVSISSSDWGSVKADLQSAYGSNQAGTATSTSAQSVTAGVRLGFLSFGGGGNHASSSASGQGSSFQAADASSYVGTRFENSTLTIPGAQILGWLCDITPASPPDDDKNYGKTTDSTTTTSTTPVPEPVHS